MSRFVVIPVVVELFVVLNVFLFYVSSAVIHNFTNLSTINRIQ